jgi:3-aminobutyryl-CoA ammonia-lyase
MRTQATTLVFLLSALCSLRNALSRPSHKGRFKCEVTRDDSGGKRRELMEARLKARMSMDDAHYGGNLVDGARVLQLFGDVATELLIRYDGDEGLFRAYSSIEFLAPVYAGDFIEVTGKIVQVGNTSRTMEFEAWKIISPTPEVSETAATVLDKPILVCKATGTCVTPEEKQRIKHDA